MRVSMSIPIIIRLVYNKCDQYMRVLRKQYKLQEEKNKCGNGKLKRERREDERARTTPPPHLIFGCLLIFNSHSPSPFFTIPRK